MTARVLVAGVGNVFFRDDGFGVEVCRRLREVKLPGDVTVADFGIRGMHLAYELLEPYGQVIIVDAVSRGEAPGTVQVLAPDLDLDSVFAGDAHGMCLSVVFSTARSLGTRLDRISIVGCEPESIGEGIGLSRPVDGAVDVAVALIRDLVTGSTGATRQEILRR